MTVPPNRCNIRKARPQSRPAVGAREHPTKQLTTTCTRDGHVRSARRVKARSNSLPERDTRRTLLRACYWSFYGRSLPSSKLEIVFLLASDCTPCSPCSQVLITQRSPHQNMTFRYVPHRIAPQPPSGGEIHDSGIVQSGSPHSTRTTNGSKLNTATAIAVRPTTLERQRVLQSGGGDGGDGGWRASECGYFIHPKAIGEHRLWWCCAIVCRAHHTK